MDYYCTPGCTDPDADNYDPNASVDDSSCVNIPSVVINNPLEGDTFPSNLNIGIDFTVSNFVVAAGSGDGHIHYYLNSAMTMKYDTLPITLNGLVNGTYEMIVELVDNSHTSLSPVVADTVNFIVQVDVLGCTDPSADNYDPNARINTTTI